MQNNSRVKTRFQKYLLGLNKDITFLLAFFVQQNGTFDLQSLADTIQKVTRDERLAIIGHEQYPSVNLSNPADIEYLKAKSRFLSRASTKQTQANMKNERTFKETAFTIVAAWNQKIQTGVQQLMNLEFFEQLVETALLRHKTGQLDMGPLFGDFVRFKNNPNLLDEIIDDTKLFIAGRENRFAASGWFAKTALLTTVPRCFDAGKTCHKVKSLNSSKMIFLIYCIKHSP